MTDDNASELMTDEQINELHLFFDGIRRRHRIACKRFWRRVRMARKRRRGWA